MRHRVVGLAIAVTLAACGGGGTGPSPGVPPPVRGTTGTWDVVFNAAVLQNPNSALIGTTRRINSVFTLSQMGDGMSGEINFDAADFVLSRFALSGQLFGNRLDYSVTPEGCVTSIRGSLTFNDAATAFTGTMLRVGCGDRLDGPITGTKR